MKKFALCFVLFFVASMSSFAQKQTTVAVLVDCKDDEFTEKLVKTAIEFQLGFTGKARFDYFPAKLQLSATIKPIKFQEKEIGYAVAYTFSEGIFYQRTPRLILLDSGLIVAPDTTQIVDILVKDFEPIFDRKRL